MEMKQLVRFLKTAVAFSAGLLCVLVVADHVLGMQRARTHAERWVGREVYVSLEHARQPSDTVRFLYLGDSVAAQLFRPGTEAGPEERFLASNQAISLAGQYYLLADALDHCPGAREVYLFYYPGSFTNDLGPPLVNDYFCAFFHEPRQILEVFAVKHDVRVATAQVGRLLLPQVLAFNSSTQPRIVQAPQAPAGPAVGTAAAGRAGDVGEAGGLATDPALTLLEKLIGGPPPSPTVAPEADGRTPVVLSNVSRHFLMKMRDLCRRRGVALHVLPVPCSDVRPFDDREGVYERPIPYESASEFSDGIHLLKPLVGPVRKKLIDAYGLPGGPREKGDAPTPLK